MRMGLRGESNILRRKSRATSRLEVRRTQCAIRACNELRQIVAGNILHYPTTGFNHFPFRSGNLQAKDHVAWRAVTQSQRPGSVGGNNTAQARFRAARRVKRNPKALTTQEMLKIAQFYSRLDA